MLLFILLYDVVVVLLWFYRRILRVYRGVVWWCNSLHDAPPPWHCFLIPTYYLYAYNTQEMMHSSPPAVILHHHDHVVCHSDESRRTIRTYSIGVARGSSAIIVQ